MASAASKMSLASSRLESMASVAASAVFVGGILGLVHYLGAERNDHVDECLISDPDYNRRKAIVP